MREGREAYFDLQNIEDPMQEKNPPGFFDLLQAEDPNQNSGNITANGYHP
jgi:hypothetical protein